jgi:hypothetical protein
VGGANPASKRVGLLSRGADRLLPGRNHVLRKPPSRTTTWWALAMYIVVLVMGSAVFGLMLAVFMNRVGWTGPYPMGTLASIIPALAVLLLVLLQTWDLVQIARYRQPMQILEPVRLPMNPWLRSALTLLVLSGAFVFGEFYWK